MKKAGGALVLLMCCACGGGGGVPAAAANLSAQELVEQCVAADLADLAGLLDLLQNFLDETGPQPQFDLVTGVLTGRVPWTLDLDEDGVADLGGTIFFTDENGDLTIPVDDLGALLDGDLTDVAAIVAGLEGNTLHLEFDFDGLLTQTPNAATGNGEFTFEFGAAGAVTASGVGHVESGDCTFDFDFADVGTDLLDATEFPVASLNFDLVSGPNSVGGSIELDGTETARVEARANGGEPEVFLLDLTAASAG